MSRRQMRREGVNLQDGDNTARVHGTNKSAQALLRDPRVVMDFPACVVLELTEDRSLGGAAPTERRGRKVNYTYSALTLRRAGVESC